MTRFIQNFSIVDFSFAIAMLALTLLAYVVSLKFTKVKILSVLPPLLTTAMLILLALYLTDIDIKSYQKGGDIIIYMLGPATVALAFPLYKYWDLARRNAAKVLTVAIVSGVSSIGTTILFCRLFGVDKEFEPALISKCVTTPVAIEISNMLVTYSELSVCAVFVAGMFGTFFGHTFLKIFRLKNDAETGMVMGAISHVIGTAKCLKFSQKQGALAALTLVVCAIFTAILALSIY